MEEALEHAPLASRVLREVLARWATPINQLRYQTHRALADCLRADYSLPFPFSQLGALSAMTALGANVLDEYVLPSFPVYADVVERRAAEPGGSGWRREDHKRVYGRLFSLLMCAVSSVLHRYCRGIEEPSHNFLATHAKMLDVFGDGLCSAPLPPLNRRPVINAAPTISLGVGRIRVKRISSPVVNNGPKRVENGPSSLATKCQRRNEGHYADSLSLNDFADLGVPNDIFEDDGGDGRRRSGGSRVGATRAAPQRGHITLVLPGGSSVPKERLKQRGFLLRAAYEATDGGRIEGVRRQPRPVLSGGHMGGRPRTSWPKLSCSPTLVL